MNAGDHQMIDHQCSLLVVKFKACSAIQDNLNLKMNGEISVVRLRLEATCSTPIPNMHVTIDALNLE